MVHHGRSTAMSCGTTEIDIADMSKSFVKTT